MPRPNNILGLDTTFAACSAAVRVSADNGGAQQISQRFEEMTTGHAERLVPMVEEVMQEAGCGFDALDGIAVTVGPGSFTGTRVGVSVARGLALAAGLTVFGASSLAVMAEAAFAGIGDFNPDTDVLLMCVDARRGQVYVQEFDGPGRPPLCEPRICALDTVFRETDDKRVVVVGSAAQAVLDAPESAGAERYERGPPINVPAAADLLNVHLQAMTPPRPLYLRPPDAKPQSGKSIPRVQP